jgi:monofunctional chorismate mutase
VVGIRGATTININNEKEISTNTVELMEKVILDNDLERDKIAAIFFSCTKDITAAYPAKTVREMGFADVPLMCFQEMDVQDSLQKCIRICVFYNGEIEKKDVRHIYLNNAKKLRPDLLSSE